MFSFKVCTQSYIMKVALKLFYDRANNLFNIVSNIKIKRRNNSNGIFTASDGSFLRAGEKFSRSFLLAGRILVNKKSRLASPDELNIGLSIIICLGDRFIFRSDLSGHPCLVPC